MTAVTTAPSSAFTGAPGGHNGADPRNPEPPPSPSWPGASALRPACGALGGPGPLPRLPHAPPQSLAAGGVCSAVAVRLPSDSSPLRLLPPWQQLPEPRGCSPRPGPAPLLPPGSARPRSYRPAPLLPPGSARPRSYRPARPGLAPLGPTPLLLPCPVRPGPAWPRSYRPGRPPARGVTPQQRRQRSGPSAARRSGRRGEGPARTGHRWHKAGRRGRGLRGFCDP